MSKRKMTAEYLREMVKKSFANVDIDEGCKMCVLPFQSLVDTVNLYEDKLAWQEVEIQQLTEEKAELQKQVDKLKGINETLICDNVAYKEHIAKMDELLKGIGKRIDDAESEFVKRAVKDILILAEDYNCGTENDIDNFILALKERYGVEVE